MGRASKDQGPGDHMFTDGLPMRRSVTVPTDEQCVGYVRAADTALLLAVWKYCGARGNACLLDTPKALLCHVADVFDAPCC